MTTNPTTEVDGKLQLLPPGGAAPEDVVMGSFTRHGGVSVAPFSSCNISFGVGDVGGNVESNRERIKQLLGTDILVSARQIHGDQIYHLNSRPDKDLRIDGYDALMTSIAGVALLIGHADCQAIMLYDPEHKAIAAVHSGWRGTVANIVAATVAAMQECFGTRPERLIVGIGPSLGPCCAEFINYRDELPAEFQRFMSGPRTFHFWEITRHQLRDCGVLPGFISLPSICTSCSADFFSYRRACRNSNGVTGRNGSVVMIP